MQRYKAAILLAFVCCLALSLWSPATGQTKRTPGKKKAASPGAKVFDIKCSVCHDGGNNTIEPEKTLKLAALKKYGFNSVEDIKKRVMEGKGIMPAFKEELSQEEINAVAAYVWQRAQNDWR